MKKSILSAYENSLAVLHNAILLFETMSFNYAQYSVQSVWILLYCFPLLTNTAAFDYLYGYRLLVVKWAACLVPVSASRWLSYLQFGNAANVKTFRISDAQLKSWSTVFRDKIIPFASVSLRVWCSCVKLDICTQLSKLQTSLLMRQLRTWTTNVHPVFSRWPRHSQMRQRTHRCKPTNRRCFTKENTGSNHEGDDEDKEAFGMAVIPNSKLV